jgi:hypothetical protein
VGSVSDGVAQERELVGGGRRQLAKLVFGSGRVVCVTPRWRVEVWRIG